MCRETSLRLSGIVFLVESRSSETSGQYEQLIGLFLRKFSDKFRF